MTVSNLNFSLDKQNPSSGATSALHSWKTLSHPPPPSLGEVILCPGEPMRQILPRRMENVSAAALPFVRLRWLLGHIFLGPVFCPQAGSIESDQSLGGPAPWSMEGGMGWGLYWFVAGLFV